MTKNTTPTEFAEARTLAEYLDMLLVQKKILAYSHTNQETYTKSWNQKNKNKAMGVRPGLPDYVIVTPSKVLFLELKREKGNYPTKHQKRWIEAISDGKKATATVAYGFDEAKEFVDDELAEGKN